MKNRFAVILSVLALIAVVGCGDKAKKKATMAEGPASDGSGTGESTGPDSTATDPNASLNPVIYFEFDKAELEAAARTKLEENAEWLKEGDSRVLTIEGHTDEVGTGDYNLALGERRAKQAKDYLVRLGVNGDRVSIITYGEERPAGSDDALNRRSMFIATKK